MRVVVTGDAGFIGAAVCQQLLRRGDEVFGLDSLNDYYPPALKLARLELLAPYPKFRRRTLLLEDHEALEAVFREFQPQRVVHLAAQAGVRYSLQQPRAYVASNLSGFLNVLEACRQHQVEHLVYASSSSVYGANRKLPFAVSDAVDHPVSLYAATKKANELMAHSYSHLYRLPTTGLRFFTVYGPWGRPDMAPLMFTRKIFAGEALTLFNHGRHSRDFTYIDDIVEGVIRTLDRPATANPDFDPLHPNTGTSTAPYRLYNIGNHQPVELRHFIELLELHIGRSVEKLLAPMQPGDVIDTCADVEALMRDTGYAPSTPIEVGVEKLVRWYRENRELLDAL